jgi:NAD(P)-dependent dehydrogenase (short-subunit alcohol dehydrogenase family)
MAKHGVGGITKSAACELATYGIRVNAVAPGNTVTDMTSAVITQDPSDHATATKFIARGSPLGIAGLPEDIAAPILFLLSDEARYITGHILVADAGQTSSGPPQDFHSRKPDVLLHAGKHKNVE